jgi:phosphoserine phosphatase RsbU/P
MNSSGKVLIIEDDPQLRMTLTAYLEDSGYAIFEAADGVEGLEIFTENRPEIVLTDLRMPRMDGFAVIARIKELSPTTPVIAFTGTGDPLAADNALRLGARECLFKPIDLEILETVVKKAIKQVP